MQTNDWIEVDVGNLEALANDLAMHLAFCRHIDDEVSADLGVAAEAMFGRSKRPTTAIVGPLSRPRSADAVWRRCDSVFGELTDFRDDLATPADASTAAYRIEVDAELPRCSENAGSAFYLTLTTRRCEDDADGIGHSGTS